MIADMESVTAKLCSFSRAYHSNREKERIFDDYLAFDLMGREEYEKIGQLIEHDYDLESYNPTRDFKGDSIKETLDTYLAPIPLSRAAFAEKELKRFSEKNSKCQYVILGAGMDTFAFRNDNENIEIFEVDHPDTQKYKLEKIKALEWIIPQNANYVPVDFAKDDMRVKLIEAGFDENMPTFFAFLGVTYYLSLPVFEETLEKIKSLASKGSRLVFDFPDDTTLSQNAPERVKILSEITAHLGEPMKHGYSVLEIDDALDRQGFKTIVHETPDTIQKMFFEGRSDGKRAYENIHFIVAKPIGYRRKYT